MWHLVSRLYFLVTRWDQLFPNFELSTRAHRLSFLVKGRVCKVQSWRWWPNSNPQFFEKLSFLAIIAEIWSESRVYGVPERVSFFLPFLASLGGGLVLGVVLVVGTLVYFYLVALFYRNFFLRNCSIISSVVSWFQTCLQWLVGLKIDSIALLQVHRLSVFSERDSTVQTVIKRVDLGERALVSIEELLRLTFSSVLPLSWVETLPLPRRLVRTSPQGK